ncbi:DUF6241 domain-containing protein [Pseudalkalibacillus caeni]|uniref:Uncharacterized protein n=1 Tax=Exobacillus caeni TaxID=2574798 RepID=A0A5R9EYS1_9BACL|nr:DUF6241 domain-containing protein [Pseudalkalibacillus caeni]TLS35589.1 hypothetical protein FCL54_19720 [Pseudalkalibacillus caeni]
MIKTKNLIIIFTTLILIFCAIMYWMIVEASETVNGKEDPKTEQAAKNSENGSNKDALDEIDEQIDAATATTTENEEDGVKKAIPTEVQFQDDLHAMTHQKVKAEEKWGHLKITEERIDEMLDVLDKVKGKNDYKNFDFYYDVLTEWNNGNFDNAVQAHNRIWSMNGGTIGKATRLLTEEEEQAYIKEYFK